MSNPQQPELRRSERGATVEGSAEAHADQTLEAAEDPLPEDVIPEENRPGHRPARDQDQPDHDRFAERLGLADEPGEDDQDGEDAGAT